jgi:iron complex transport system ATP-binding protein
MNVSAAAIRATKIVLGERFQTDSFVVAPGECVVVSGPNGSGKSSLLRLLAGLEPSLLGRVEIAGEDLRRLSRREIAQRLAWLPQRPDISEAMTCVSLIATARFRFMESRTVAEVRAMEFLAEHDAGHLAGRLTSQISGGELQRVLLAAMSAQEAPLLLVDEPANHLDPLHQVTTYRRLGELWRQEERTLIIVSHDLRLAKLLGPPELVRIVGIKSARIFEETTLADPDLPGMLERLYGLPFVGAREAGAFSVDLSHKTLVMEASR